MRRNSKNDPYMKALRESLNDTSPAPPTTRSREEIEADLTSISEQLRGPLANVERLCLVEDRNTLRKQLAAATT